MSDWTPPTTRITGLPGIVDLIVTVLSESGVPGPMPFRTTTFFMYCFSFGLSFARLRGVLTMSFTTSMPLISSSCALARKPSVPESRWRSKQSSPSR